MVEKTESRAQRVAGDTAIIVACATLVLDKGRLSDRASETTIKYFFGRAPDVGHCIVLAHH